MTRKQERFVEEYVKDFNQTQAAIRAGFSPRGANVAAQRMLLNATILSLINQRLDIVRVREKKVDEFTHEKIAYHFKEIYDRCMQGAPVMRWDASAKEFVPLTDDEGNAVWEFDSTGANRAMENIAKHKGFFELDNSQKKSVIQIAILPNGNHDPIAGQITDTSQAADSGVFTLLPPTTDQHDT